jgi:hypothetical protein
MSKKYCPTGTPFSIMAKKIEKKIKANPKEVVTITITKKFEFNKKTWEELRDHLVSIYNDNQIIERFDSWSLDYHLNSIKDPAKVTHKIK